MTSKQTNKQFELKGKKTEELSSMTQRQQQWLRGVATTKSCKVEMLQ